MRKLQQEFEDLRDGTSSIQKFDWKNRSNEFQFKHNLGVLKVLNKVMTTIDKAEGGVMQEELSDIDNLETRQKHLQIADKYGPKGWKVVEQYSLDPLAEDGSDEKRLRKAASFVAEQYKVDREEIRRKVSGGGRGGYRGGRLFRWDSSAQ